MYFVKKNKNILRFAFSFFFGLFSNYKKNKLFIFNYHNFSVTKSIKSSMFVNYLTFKKQMIYFKKYTNVLSLDDFMNKNYKKKMINIFLTIDDADISLMNLNDIIKDLCIPITIFLPMGLMINKNNIDYYRSNCLHHFFFINKNASIEKKELFFKNLFDLQIKDLILLDKKLSIQNKFKDFVISRKKISENDLKTLIENKNITFGSHSMSHVHLSKLPPMWLNWEIEKSIFYIRKFNGCDKIFSLPYGNFNSFNKNVLSICKKNNIHVVFTSLNIVNNFFRNHFGRSYVLNSSNYFYLRGLIHNSMNYFDKLLKRI